MSSTDSSFNLGVTLNRAGIVDLITSLAASLKNTDGEVTLTVGTFGSQAFVRSSHGSTGYVAGNVAYCNGNGVFVRLSDGTLLDCEEVNWRTPSDRTLSVLDI